MAVSPRPPYSCGQFSPNQPFSPILRRNAVSSPPWYSRPCSAISARSAGVTFSARNCRTSATQARCSSSSSKSTEATLSPSCLLGGRSWLEGDQSGVGDTQEELTMATTDTQIDLDALSTGEHGYTVDDEDDDEPVLLDRNGDPVETWRERYPYDERMSRKEYEQLKRRLQIELLKLQKWCKQTGARHV